MLTMQPCGAIQAGTYLVMAQPLKLENSADGQWTTSRVSHLVEDAATLNELDAKCSAGASGVDRSWNGSENESEVDAKTGLEDGVSRAGR